MTYPSQPSYPSPYGVPPAKKSNNARFIVLGGVGAVVILSCGLCGIGALLAGNDAKNPSTAAQSPTIAVALPAVENASPEPSPTTAKPAPPSPSPSPKAPAEATMANVVGKNAAVAEDELKRLGFTRIQFGSQDTGDTVVLLPANWTVTKQSAKAGQEIPTDTLIVLTCTKKS